MTTKHKDGFIPDYLLTALAAAEIKNGNKLRAKRFLASVSKPDSIMFAMRQHIATGNRHIARQIMLLAPKAIDNKLWLPPNARAQGRFAPRVTMSGARSLFDAHSQEVRGTLVRSEGESPTSDATVNLVYDNLGDIRTFIKTKHNRDSVDGKGMALLATVHFGTNYANAQWTGEAMEAGDGDGVYMGPLTSKNVFYHEMGHGEVQHFCPEGLDYWGQSGAGNESEADCGAAAGESHDLNQSALEYHWLIGKGVWLPGEGNRTALRSMLKPGTGWKIPGLGQDSQPSKMSGYVKTRSDGGGVHTNSGPPNHAFCLQSRALQEAGKGDTWETTTGVIEAIRIAAQPHLPKTASFAQVAYWRIQACSIFPDRESELREILGRVYADLEIMPDKDATDTLTPSPDDGFPTGDDQAS